MKPSLLHSRCLGDLPLAVVGCCRNVARGATSPGRAVSGAPITAASERSILTDRKFVTNLPLAIAFAAVLLAVLRVVLAAPDQRVSVAEAWAGPFVMVGGTAVLATAAWIGAHLRWRHPDLAALRQSLAQHALLACLVLTAGGAFMADQAGTDNAWVLMLFVHAPTLAIGVSLLWSTLVAVNSTCHRTSLTAAFMVVVVVSQCLAPPATMREPGELWFLLNSLVLGWAVALRLIVWTRQECGPGGA